MITSGRECEYLLLMKLETCHVQFITDDIILQIFYHAFTIILVIHIQHLNPIWRNFYFLWFIFYECLEVIFRECKKNYYISFFVWIEKNLPNIYFLDKHHLRIEKLNYWKTNSFHEYSISIEKCLHQLRGWPQVQWRAINNLVIQHTLYKHHYKVNLAHKLCPPPTI